MAEKKKAEKTAEPAVEKKSKKKAAAESDEAVAVAEKPAPPPPAGPKPKLEKNIRKEKLAPKNKSRLPRKLKKAQKKAAAARG